MDTRPRSLERFASGATLRPKRTVAVRASLIATGLCVLLIAWSAPAAYAQAAGVYYLGSFSGSVPLDDSDCGTGRGAHPSPHPCETLAHWNTSRRSVLTSGNVVRLAAGTYGPQSNAQHCLRPTAGVLYEGRQPSDAEAASAATVVINLSSTPNSAPCFANAIENTTSSLSGFGLRSLTLLGSNNGGNSAWINSSSVTTGLSFRYFRVTGSAAPFFVGQRPTSQNPSPTTRNVRNFTCDFCEFDNNNGTGLELDYVDGFALTNSTFHDNGPGDDLDGLHLGGAINGLIRSVGVWNNGEDGIDFSRTGATADNCPASTHDIVMERSYVFNHPNANVSLNSCVYNITIRNSMIWGSGIGLNMYYCSGGNTFENNTVVVNSDSPFFAYSFHKNLVVRNNILISRTGSQAVFLDMHTVGAGNGGTWDGNVLDAAGANVLSVQVGDGTAGAQACANDVDYPHGSLTSAAPQGSYANSSAGLTSWRNADRFGSTTADRDKWSDTPTFVNVNSPSVAGLHLASGDSIARGAGLVLPGFSTDFDGELRGPVWDIGADQFGGTPPVTPASPTSLRILQ